MPPKYLVRYNIIKLWETKDKNLDVVREAALYL